MRTLSLQGLSPIFILSTCMKELGDQHSNIKEYTAIVEEVQAMRASEEAKAVTWKINMYCKGNSSPHQQGRPLQY